MSPVGRNTKPGVPSRASVIEKTNPQFVYFNSRDQRSNQTLARRNRAPRSTVDSTDRLILRSRQRNAGNSMLLSALYLIYLMQLV